MLPGRASAHTIQGSLTPGRHPPRQKHNFCPRERRLHGEPRGKSAPPRHPKPTQPWEALADWLVREIVYYASHPINNHACHLSHGDVASTTVQCQGWLFLAEGAKQAISINFISLDRSTEVSLKLRMERRERINCSACAAVRLSSFLMSGHISGLSQSKRNAPVGQTATQWPQARQ
jgi:hypothetical protein